MAIELDTPKKARIQGALQLARVIQERHSIRIFDRDIAAILDTSRASVAKIRSCPDASARTLHNRVDVDPRGRPSILGDRECQTLTDNYRDHGIAARAMTWDAQAADAGIEACSRTVRKAMARRGYHKYRARRKRYMKAADCAARVRYAERMLDIFELSDWRQVRFSDETHFGWNLSTNKSSGPWISRLEGHGTDPDCVWEDPPRDNNNDDRPQEPRVHCWAAVGYDFKSPLVRYDSGNSNGKLTQAAYLDQILRPVVGSWLDAGDQDWVLLEDNDSGHCPSGKGACGAWKREHLDGRFMFNVSNSPDLNIIENTWRVPDNWVGQHRIHIAAADDLYGLAVEGWAQLKQSSINAWVDSMPTRLRDVVRMEGRMTAVEHARPEEQDDQAGQAGQDVDMQDAQDLDEDGEFELEDA